MEMNPPNQQTGTQLDTESEDSLNPELLKQINTEAGMGVLKELLKSGVFKTNNDPIEDRVAIHLLTHDALKKDKSALKDLADKEITKSLTRFVEKLGSMPAQLDKKSQEKLIIMARKIVAKMPGMRGIGLDSIDKITGELLTAFSAGDSEQLHKIIDNEINHGKKKKLLHDKVEGIFEGNYPAESEPKEEDLSKIHDYLKDGELTNQLKETQSFAEGGEVHKPIAEGANSDQDMMIGAGKARINAYLNSLRPQDNPKLPFDTKHISKESNKTYKEGLKLAASPLSILDHIPKGTISPTNLKHSMALHPELHSLINKKVTEKITKQQLLDKKPPYKTRQALSLMMQQPLDSTMTPMSIQAAQSTFMPTQPPQQAGKPKKDTGKIGSKSNAMYQTPDENAEQDRSTRD